MTRFHGGQRIVVTRADHPMVGEFGRVVQVARRYASSWVDMERDLPGDLRTLPVDDPGGRKNYMYFYASECEPAPAEQTA